MTIFKIGATPRICWLYSKNRNGGTPILSGIDAAGSAIWLHPPLLGIFFDYVSHAESFNLCNSKKTLIHHLSTLLKVHGIKLGILNLYLRNLIYHVPHIALYTHPDDLACCIIWWVHPVALGIPEEVLLIILKIMPQNWPPLHPLHYILYNI